jgi:integrase
MAVYKRRGGRIWWYRFTWDGVAIRESTKQTNKRVAEQIEAAHKTSLAKGEVGIRQKKRIPTVAEFAEKDFLPHIRSRFADKRSTLAYYEIQTRHLTEYRPLATALVDGVTPKIVSGFVAKGREAEYQVSSINRALQVLRRMCRLAVQWGRAEKAMVPISLLPGERRRERVLHPSEQAAYLQAAQAFGEKRLEVYACALKGIRATQRGERPIEPEDPFLLRDVTTILLDEGIRPEECHRLAWEEIRDGAMHVAFGKTANARRSIPLTNRVAALLEMRKSASASQWVFPAPTQSGHIEQSSLKKGHANACVIAGIEYFPLYTFRHTCLTLWSAHMDPYTLAYFAGHSDFATTRRYIHPDLQTGREAMERARVAQGGHNSGHTGATERSDRTPIEGPQGYEWERVRLVRPA